jgi:hypothetical protein
LTFFDVMSVGSMPARGQVFSTPPKEVLDAYSSRTARGDAAMPLHFMRRREFITLLGGAAMPMTKEKMSPLNGNGHQNLIAQPGTSCPIEFRRIHKMRTKE